MWRWLGRAGEEAGQAVVLVGLSLPVLLAAGGLGIDAGLQFVERRHAQVAADAAAYAAATALTLNYTAPDRATLARNAALDYASRNGYDNDGTTNTVTVATPASGAFVGSADHREVIITVNVRTAFIRILGPSFQTQRVQARAVGGVVTAKTYGIMALSRTASPGLSVTGDKVKIEAKDGGVFVNSNAATAVVITGKADVKSKERGLDVVGDASIDSQAKVDGTVTTGVPALRDPMAYLVPPSGAGIDQGPISVSSGTTTLQPGIYTSLTVTGSGKLKLNAGTYIIKGGGITVSGEGKIDDEKGGVLLYNACSDMGVCGAITITGHGKIDLTDKKPGSYEGLALWQPKENTQPITINAADEASSDAKARIHTRGSIYAPTAAISVNGDAKIEIKDDNDVNTTGMLVASTLSFGDKSDINVKWKKDDVTNVVRSPALVE